MTDEEFDKLAQVAYPIWLDCINPDIEEVELTDDQAELIDLFIAICIKKAMGNWTVTSNRVIH